MKITGAAAATAFVAGCGGDDGGDDGNGNGGNGDDGENGNGNGGNGGDALEPGQIEFIGNTGGWEGVAPDAIAGETNPTITLQEGETYEIGWNEGDGGNHNIEIWNDSDEVVGDYATEPTTETEPEDQWVEFEASSEMASYVCEIHATQMIGDIEVVEGNGGGNGNSSE